MFLPSVRWGASLPRILFVHILPNIIGILAVLAAMDIPAVIALEAGLSFLGMGVKPPTPSWGVLLKDGYALIRNTPWPIIARWRADCSRDAGLYLSRGNFARYYRSTVAQGAMTVPLLEIRDFSLNYDKVRALRHVTLSVNKGEIVGIVGESGCGKSSLTSAILRLLPENAGTRGEIFFQWR